MVHRLDGDLDLGEPVELLLEKGSGTVAIAAGFVAAPLSG
jgi:hypothetical protein